MDRPAVTDRPNPFELIIRWWTDVFARDSRLAELNNLPVAEQQRVAADFGVSFEELKTAAARPDGAHELLDRRLTALGLDQSELAHDLPAVLRDLQRTCARCPDQKQCREDMEASPLESGWESYCPNSGTLRMLS